MQHMNVDEALRAALANHQAGRLQEAEAAYRQILAADANCASAWHLLGVLAHQVGRSDAGAQMISRAIQLGMGSEAYNNLGECYRAMAKYPEAVNAYQAAIQQNPNNAEAYSNLGLIYNSAGRYTEAIPYLEKAISLKSNLANARFNYGIALDNTGKLDDAIEQWEIALRHDPNHAMAMNNLGVALQRRERLERAVTTLRKLVEKFPNWPEAHANLGSALAAAGKYDEAIAEATKAVEMEPYRAEAHNTLGVVYMRAGKFEEALASTKHAVELSPRFHKAVGNVGGIYQKMDRHTEAAEWFERAAEILPTDIETANALYGAYYKSRRPDKSLEVTERALKHAPNNAELHGNRSLALLALGRYIEGFEEYEWRWRCGTFTSPTRDFDRPMWDGRDPSGRTILIHSEQGFGDVIQFARYIPMVVETGARVLVEVPSGVRELIGTIPGIMKMIPKGLKLPDFDLHVPLLSLPHIFKTTVETIPQNVPYVRADEARLAKWKQVIEASARGLKVGLVWGGNVKPDPKRSTTLKELAVLADVPNVTWYSLQTADPRKELDDAPPEMKVLDVGKDLKDFSDTAAVMSMLDLVITIDTASAHLAGAIGASCWTMIPYAADWRWFMEGESSPWYPTMRLFRQESLNDWTPVIARIREELMKQSS